MTKKQNPDIDEVRQQFYQKSLLQTVLKTNQGNPWQVGNILRAFMATNPPKDIQLLVAKNLASDNQLNNDIMKYIVPKFTTTEALDTLLASPHNNKRRSILYSPLVTDEQLQKLYKDTDSHNKRLAKNHLINRGILEQEPEDLNKSFNRSRRLEALIENLPPELTEQQQTKLYKTLTSKCEEWHRIKTSGHGRYYADHLFNFKNDIPADKLRQIVTILKPDDKEIILPCLLMHSNYPYRKEDINTYYWNQKNSNYAKLSKQYADPQEIIAALDQQREHLLDNLDVKAIDELTTMLSANEILYHCAQKKTKLTPEILKRLAENFVTYDIQTKRLACILNNYPELLDHSRTHISGYTLGPLIAQRLLNREVIDKVPVQNLAQIINNADYKPGQGTPKLDV